MNQMNSYIKNKLQFLKLLLIAIICDVLVIGSLILIDLKFEYKDFESASNFVGALVLINTIFFVARYDLKVRARKTVLDEVEQVLKGHLNWMKKHD